MLDRYSLNVKAVVLAMEYRRVANCYLSHKTISSIDEIDLGPLPDVRDMLVADKVQNRKDFEVYHLKTHPRSNELLTYFSNWLKALGISEERYLELVGVICSQGD